MPSEVPESRCSVIAGRDAQWLRGVGGETPSFTLHVTLGGGGVGWGEGEGVGEESIAEYHYVHVNRAEMAVGLNLDEQ